MEYIFPGHCPECGMLNSMPQTSCFGCGYPHPEQETQSLPSVELVECWGFRGRGGFAVRVLRTIFGGAKELARLVAEEPGYRDRYSSSAEGHPRIACNPRVPEVIRPRPTPYMVGYRWLDDEGQEGEYYFE